MPIQSITRDWGPNPCIVRIVTSDNLATITADNYLISQAATINALNFGAFQWSPTDIALIAYNGGEGFFNVDNSLFYTFSPLEAGFLKAQIGLTAAQIKTLYTAGISIVPTAGPHTWIIPEKLVVEYDFGTTQYNAGGAFGLTYSTAAPVNGAGTAASATEAAATINGFAANNGFTLAGASTGTMASMINMGIWVTSQTQNFATGDGTMFLTLDYRIVPTIA